MKFYEATARWAFLSSSVLVVRYLELFSYLSLLLLLSFKSFSLLLLRLFKQRFVSFSSRRVLASLLEVVIWVVLKADISLRFILWDFINPILVYEADTMADDFMGLFFLLIWYL
jgi:hypothetical protein